MKGREDVGGVAPEEVAVFGSCTASEAKLGEMCSVSLARRVRTFEVKCCKR